MTLCAVDRSKNNYNHSKQQPCLNEHSNTYHQNHSFFCSKHIDASNRSFTQIIQVPFLDKMTIMKLPIHPKQEHQCKQELTHQKVKHLYKLKEYTTKINN